MTPRLISDMWPSEIRLLTGGLEVPAAYLITLNQLGWMI